MADEAGVLVSSANLIEYALNLNMELTCWCAGEISGAALGHLRQSVREGVRVLV